MRLTRIEIENFKGVASRQYIDLRPITLLFGANSAGKSTILQALHYLREILQRGNVDAEQTIAGGLTDLGGFTALVHNHDLERTVKFRIVLDISEGDSDMFLQSNSGVLMGAPWFDKLPVRYLAGSGEKDREEDDDDTVVKQVGLQFDIRWSANMQAPYVSRLVSEMNGEKLATIVSWPGGSNISLLTEFNFSHPLLQPVVSGETSEIHSDDFMTLSPLEKEILNLAQADAMKSLPDIYTEQPSIGIRTKVGEYPWLYSPLFLYTRDPNPDEKTDGHRQRVFGLHSLLSELILGPTQLVELYLRQITYIGPLRTIPPRNFRPQLPLDEARWAQGLAAWDLLYTDYQGGLVERVNHWLADKDRLATPYKLERCDIKELPVPVKNSLLRRELDENQIDDVEMMKLIRNLPMRSIISLQDIESGVQVSPIDVGVGISQMIPVVVASLQNQSNILCIEQPELHVHPKIQVGMGDLFIAAAVGDPENKIPDKNLIIETHSEHIMLRLLRRLEERHEDRLPPDVQELKPDNLSVIYVENKEEGVSFQRLRVSEDGDFLDRWPHGFFRERAKELF